MKSSMVYITVLFVVFSWLLALCWGSVGDRSYPYRKCLIECKSNCGDDHVFAKAQAVHMDLLGWNCVEGCKYNCMWETVELFQKSNFSIPQFHGKWPFVRLFGVQEPASVLFSILNGVFVWIGFNRFYSQVPNTAPMYKLIILHFILSENAWFWSVVYHSRDFPITEKLDYFCATSLVLSTLYFCIYRGTFDMSQKTRKLFRWFAANIIVVAYFGHISYLSFVKFDYGYNMMFNVACGFATCVLCILFWIFKRKTLCYAWKLPTSSVVGCMLLGFELLDFPPWLWILDAHSIWHMSTIPLPLLLYSFVTDDQLYLINAVY